MALYKRPNSKYWWMKFTFDGELIQRSTKCKNRRDAETVEGALRTQLALGKVGIKPRPKAPTFKKAAEDFLEWSKITHARKPNSYTRLKYSCLPAIEYFGETKVDRIGIREIEKYISYRLGQTSRKTGEPITRSSVNLELGALKSIFKRLMMEKILADNPAAGVKRLTANDSSYHVLSDEEEKLYLMSCQQPLQDVATLMIETGMRPSEIYKLTRDRVFLDKGFLQIVGSKTKSSTRKIWLSEKTAAILRRRLEMFKGDYLFPKKETDGGGPVSQLHKLHRESVDRIGLQFKLYDCRHTFATRVLESGQDLLTLASMLGHSGLNEVMRYAHPSEARKLEAVQQMEKGRQKQSKA